MYAEIMFTTHNCALINFIYAYVNAWMYSFSVIGFHWKAWYALQQSKREFVIQKSRRQESHICCRELPTPKLTLMTSRLHGNEKRKWWKQFASLEADISTKWSEFRETALPTISASPRAKTVHSSILWTFHRIKMLIILKRGTIPLRCSQQKGNINK